MASENRVVPTRDDPFGERTVTTSKLAMDVLGKARTIICQMKVCRENSIALTKIEEAEMWLEKGSK